MTVLYDMISQSYFVHDKQVKKSDDIDKFIRKYLQANIRQDDEYSKWAFIYNYTRMHIPFVAINKIIRKHSNKNIVKNLIKNYNDVYEKMDIVQKKDINQENEEIIKQNLVMLILYNSIQCTTFIY